MKITNLVKVHHLDMQVLQKRLLERAPAYNMPGVRVDGMDVEAVYNATKDAIERAKSGNGPTLIECDTYRKYGHFEGDEQKYKTDNDPNKDRDPIIEFSEKAIQNGWMTATEADAIEAAAKETIKEAVAFAEESPLPDLETLYTDIFA